MYWLSYELKLIYLKHTFINTNFEFKKSVRICYGVKKVFLDWTSYAIPTEARQRIFPHIWSNLRHILEIFLEFLGNYPINAIIKSLT